MTERCTECKAVLRLACPPSYGREVIRVCEGCDKIYTGELLEWRIAQPSTNKSSTVPVNLRHNRSTVRIRNYTTCKHVRNQIDNHLS